MFRDDIFWRSQTYPAAAGQFRVISGDTTGVLIADISEEKHGGSSMHWVAVEEGKPCHDAAVSAFKKMRSHLKNNPELKIGYFVPEQLCQFAANQAGKEALLNGEVEISALRACDTVLQMAKLPLQQALHWLGETKNITPSNTAMQAQMMLYANYRNDRNDGMEVIPALFDGRGHVKAEHDQHNNVANIAVLGNVLTAADPKLANATQLTSPALIAQTLLQIVFDNRDDFGYLTQDALHVDAGQSAFPIINKLADALNVPSEYTPGMADTFFFHSPETGEPVLQQYAGHGNFLAVKAKHLVTLAENTHKAAKERFSIYYTPQQAEALAQVAINKAFKLINNTYSADHTASSALKEGIEYAEELITPLHCNLSHVEPRLNGKGDLLAHPKNEVLLKLSASAIEQVYATFKHWNTQSLMRHLIEPATDTSHAKLALRSEMNNPVMQEKTGANPYLQLEVSSPNSLVTRLMDNLNLPVTSGLGVCDKVMPAIQPAAKPKPSMPRLG